MTTSQHPKNQSDAPKTHDLVKPGSTIDKGKAGQPAQQGQQGQQQNNLQAAQGPTDADRQMMQQRQQEAFEMAAEREKSNNPATRPQREYSKDAPGMHPMNQPAPDTKFNKATRMDLEDITGNPGHRGVNPDAPAGSINGPDMDRTGRIESINEPSHINQNRPLRSPEGGVRPGPGPTGARPGTQEAGVHDPMASINEPPGSQVIPPGAGQGVGGEGGGIGTEYETPELESLDPDEADAGDVEDIVMHVHGSGFTPSSVIYFNGLQEPTTFVSETEVTTGVKPSLFVVPAVCPVTVRNGTSESEALEFEFLDPEEPVASRSTKRTKPKATPKKKR